MRNSSQYLQQGNTDRCGILNRQIEISQNRRVVSYEPSGCWKSWVQNCPGRPVYATGGWLLKGFGSPFAFRTQWRCIGGSNPEIDKYYKRVKEQPRCGPWWVLVYGRWRDVRCGKRFIINLCYVGPLVDSTRDPFALNQLMGTRIVCGGCGCWLSTQPHKCWQVVFHKSFVVVKKNNNTSCI